ncbi:MAG: polymer-forming cytoskeletal protein [Myxococcota bacterium]
MTLNREQAIEALAQGRTDLVNEEWQQRYETDEAFRAEVNAARALSLDVGLLVEVPKIDVGPLVARAMDAAPPAAVGRASLVAALITAAAFVLSLGQLPSAEEGLRLARTFADVLGVVFGALPEYAGAASVGALLVLLLMLRVVSTRFAAVVLIATSTLMGSPSASAQCFEGDFSAAQRVDVSGAAVPRSTALLQAADDAGLQLVSHLEDDGTVTVRADGMPLEDFLRAVLPRASTATLNGSTLVIRPGCGDTARAAVPAGEATSAGAAPPPAPPVPPSTRGPVMDRHAMGGDVVVAAGEVVKDVFSFGGDLRIEGVVLGDAVTFGGDILITGSVHGDVASFGGNIEAAEGYVGGEVVPMGGDVDVQVQTDEAEEETPAQAFFSRVAKHGVIFLLGALLLGAFRRRHAALCAAVIERPVSTAAKGLGGLILSLMLTVGFAVTLIGIPVAIALLFVTILAVYAGFAVLASVLGAVLPVERWKGRPLMQLGAGVAALFVVSFLPVLGPLTSALGVIVGFGAFVATRFRPAD